MLDLYYVEDDPNIAQAVKKYIGLFCWTGIYRWFGDSSCQQIRTNWKELPIIMAKQYLSCAAIMIDQNRRVILHMK